MSEESMLGGIDDYDNWAAHRTIRALDRYDLAVIVVSIICVLGISAGLFILNPLEEAAATEQSKVEGTK